jgi:protein phosphatase
MGTTCVCAWIIGDRLYIASVGNSRLYLIRPGELKQLNVDHTWVQEAVDAGALTPEQARSHPNANIIRRYLGSRQQIEVDLRLRLDENESDEQERKNQGLKLLPGDRLLLCSDGLTDLVEDGEIFNVVKTNALQGAVKSLVDLANANGGKDNITAVALEMPGGEHQWEKDRKEKPGRLSCARVFAIGLIALIALGLLGWYAFRSDLNPSLISPTPSVQVSSTDSSIITETPDTLPEIPLQTLAPGVVSPPTARSRAIRLLIIARGD